MSWLKDWRTTRAADRLVIKAQQRAANLSAMELADWIDNSLNEICLKLDAWRHTENSIQRLDAVRDCATSAEALLVLIEELELRQQLRVERQLGTPPVSS